MPAVGKLLAIAALCSFVLASPAPAASTSTAVAATATTSSSTTTCTSSKMSKTKTKTKTKTKKTSTSSTSTTTSSCMPTTTSTANFDTLPTGSAIPTNYAAPGLDWTNGFSVVSASANNIVATSGDNVAQSSPYGTYLLSNLELSNGATLESFSFACTAPFYSGGSVLQIPTDCTLTLLGQLSEFGSSIATYGPYQYTSCGFQPPCNMTTVNVGQYVDSLLGWVLTSGPAYGSFYVDDVVISAINNC